MKKKKCALSIKKKRNDRINCIDLKKKNVTICSTNNRNWNNFMGHRSVLDPKMIKRKTLNWTWSSGSSKQWFAEFFFILEPSIHFVALTIHAQIRIPCVGTTGKQSIDRSIVNADEILHRDLPLHQSFWFGKKISIGMCAPFTSIE